MDYATCLDRKQHRQDVATGDDIHARIRRLAQAGSGAGCFLHQNLRLPNHPKIHGRVDKQPHNSSDSSGATRAHAANIARVRQREIICIQSPESLSSNQRCRKTGLSISGPSEKLNDGAMSLATLDLSRQYWKVAERHLDHVFPPVWEYESLRQITSTSQLDAYSTFQILYKSSILRRKQACLSDPLHAYATLAVSLAGTAWVHHNTDFTHLANLFMSSAVEAMRLRCEQSSAIDPNVLYSINSLAKAETWRGDFQAALAHMRMASRMHDLLDGNVPPLLMDLALITDKQIAMHLFQSPLMPIDFDPGPAVWPSLLQRTRHSPELELAFTNLGSSLMSEPMRRILGFELGRIIHDLRECILVALDVRSFSDTNPIEPTYARWFYLRATAIMYRLLRLRDSVAKPVEPSSSSSSRSRSQDCVIIALITWLATITADFSFSQFRTDFVHRLAAALTACIRDAGADADTEPGTEADKAVATAAAAAAAQQQDSLTPRVMLWAASLGVSIAFDEPAAQNAFRACVYDMTARLNLQYQDDVIRVLEQAFYLRTLQDGSALELFKLKLYDIRSDKDDDDVNEDKIR